MRELLDAIKEYLMRHGENGGDYLVLRKGRVDATYRFPSPHEGVEEMALLRYLDIPTVRLYIEPKGFELRVREGEKPSELCLRHLHPKANATNLIDFSHYLVSWGASREAYKHLQALLEIIYEACTEATKPKEV